MTSSPLRESATGRARCHHHHTTTTSSSSRPRDPPPAMAMGRTSRSFLIRLLLLCQVGFMLLVWYRPILHLQGPGGGGGGADGGGALRPPGYHSLSMGGGNAMLPQQRIGGSRKRSGYRALEDEEGEEQQEAASAATGRGLADLGVRLAAEGPLGGSTDSSASSSKGPAKPAGASPAAPDAAVSGPGAFKPVALDASKWLFFVRVQKTGSETLWKSLLMNWDGRLWGRSRMCPNGYFCGYRCQAVVERFMEAFEAGKEKCKLLVRGHIGVHDYLEAAKANGMAEDDVVLFTMLRDPIQRVMSEYIHVTRNLPSQFGPKAYGRAWDYNYTGPADDLTAFLECQACQVGVSNRQTRMLAGLFTTGTSPEKTSDGGDDEAMLQRAISNLERMAFVGIMERYEDSMLMLKRTFPTQLRDFDRYTYSKHPHDGSSQRLRLSEEQLDRMKSLNRLDLALYDRALELFQSRWQHLRALSPSSASSSSSPLAVPDGRSWERFVGVGDGKTYTLKPADKDDEEEEWTRPVTDYGVKGKGRGGDDDDDRSDDVVPGTRGQVGSNNKPAAIVGVSSPAPKTIQEYENFQDAITSTDIPLCRPSRLASPADFELEPPDEAVEDTQASYHVPGSILDKYKSVSLSTVRQLCLSKEACEGFIFNRVNATASLLGAATGTADESTVEVVPGEEVVYRRRAGQWDEGDPLAPLLERYRERQLLQVATSRDTQFDAYGGSNPALRCRIQLPGPLVPGTPVRYEVYEPVDGISRYEILAKLDYVGPWKAMQACRARAECAALSLVVRDGHAYLLKIDDKGTGVANLRMREPNGNGGDGTFRLYVKQPLAATDKRSKGKQREAPVPIAEKEVTFSDYAFLPYGKTKLVETPATPRPAGVVVSLTTIPSRVHQLQDTLLSLAQQTRPPDRILLAMPTISAREGGRPYVIPQWLRDMELVHVLEVEEDYGPATKLIPAIKHLKEHAPNHLVIVVDDDTHYPPRLVETMIRWHELLPNVALSFRGWAVHHGVIYLSFSDSYIVFGNDLMAPHPVSVLTANCGYMVQTAFFDHEKLANFTDAPEGARWMDDVWISGQLARRGVPRVVVPFDEHQYTYNSYLPGLTLDTIRLHTRGKEQQHHRSSSRPISAREAANNQALSYFHGDWDVLWREGYRIFSEALGIPYATPRTTTRFRGPNQRRDTSNRAYEEEGPITGPKGYQSGADLKARKRSRRKQGG